MDLATILAEGEDWALFPTSVAGLYVQKLPNTKRLPARLAVAINPHGPNGMPTKKRGYILRSEGELVALRKVANEEKIKKLLEMIDDVQGGIVPVAQGGTTTIIEI